MTNNSRVHYPLYLDVSEMISAFTHNLEALPHKLVANNVFEVTGTHVIRVRWIGRMVTQPLRSSTPPVIPSVFDHNRRQCPYHELITTHAGCVLTHALTLRLGSESRSVLSVFTSPVHWYVPLSHPIHFRFANGFRTQNSSRISPYLHICG